MRDNLWSRWPIGGEETNDHVNIRSWAEEGLRRRPSPSVDGVREFCTVLNGPVDPASAERLRLLPALDMSGAGGGLHLRCIVEAPAPRLRG